MAIIKDELGIDVEENVLQRAQDPKFQETEALLDYRDKRNARKRELAEEEQRKEREKEENEKLFGLF